MDILPPAFKALAKHNQFIVYKLIPRQDVPGKLDKIPLDLRTGKACDPTDPTIWNSADKCISVAKLFGKNYGVGFVFTENDPFFFLDIDNCLTEKNMWSDLAQSLMKNFVGAAMEVSSSSRGIHVIGSGLAPTHSCTSRNAPGLELYTEKRFVALTGINAVGDAGFQCDSALQDLIAIYFPKSSDPINKTNWTFEPVLEWLGPTSDQELLNRALKSQSARSVFNNSASFKDLWENNESVLTQAYPSETGDSYNRSKADAALAQHLAFWTGNNCERIRHLMTQSALVREKYEREDYLERTILNACSMQKEFLCDKPPEAIDASATACDDAHKAEVVQGSTFLSIEHQIEHFKGCTYITDIHAILVPGGEMLTQDRFKVKFGGFSFPVDGANQRVTRNAWEAFTESQVLRHKRADTYTFRPDKRPGTILQQDGKTMANIYWPIDTARVKGDPAPFLLHIAKLLPDPRDQKILLCYLAACVQWKGVKFQWCPVIQGVEGNGKSLLTKCVAFAIGIPYCHFPKAAELTSRFNDWMFKTLFIGIDDIFSADPHLDLIEFLKTPISEEYLEIEPKGQAKITRRICCNFLINTNHKDGLRKTQNDRRFAPFYTAQQSVDHLHRDGMDGDYFYHLYRWLKNESGYEIVCDFLHSYEIDPEFNPATKCQRAPLTSTTKQAIAESIGAIEQEINEAIEEQRIGFKNGWVSSFALNSLIAEHKMQRRYPPNKRRALMQSLGYDWHPGLKDGRVKTIVQPDNGKPRLYIKNGHSAGTLIDSHEVEQRYSKDQL